MKKFSNNVILASSSPRRKEILADMGVKYEVIPADIDESEIKSRFPFLLVRKLAKAKAEHIAKEHRSDTVARQTQSSCSTAKCTANRTTERALSI